jgi:peptidylprolyl isomerase domain and WD repeat-containing protein 1
MTAEWFCNLTQVEYWRPDINTDSKTGWQFPDAPDVSFTYKSDTDLYEFKKAKAVPTCLEFSPTFDKFVTFGFADGQVRVFTFKTGKLMRKYDESITAASEMQQTGTSANTLDDMEFGYTDSNIVAD